MRVAVVGDGPAGLSFAASMKSLAPEWTIELWGRSPGSDNGFGLVLPSRTVDSIMAWDPDIGSLVAERGVRWSVIDVRYGGAVVSSRGHDYVSIGRRELLNAMQTRCRALGVDLRWEEPAGLDDLAADVDVLVGADGVNSRIRLHWSAKLRPELKVGRNIFLWTSAPTRLDAFSFYIIESRFGTVVLHTYPYELDRSVVIVELSSRSLTSVANPELLDFVQDVLGVPIDSNGPDWQQFSAVSLERWSAGNIVVVGDAAHAAHFSIGSGTKMALDDGRTLAQCLIGAPVDQALATYESSRRPAVAALQEAAAASSQWFERIDDHLWRSPVQFAEQLLGRAGRVADCQLVVSSEGTAAPTTDSIRQRRRLA